MIQNQPFIQNFFAVNRLPFLLFFFLKIINPSFGQTKAEAEAAVKNQFKNPEKVVWVKHFRGRLDELNDVLIALGSDGRELRGTLEYIESHTKFKLEGQLNGAEFTLRELDEKGQNSGKIAGKLINKGFSAEWVNAATTIAMRLDATEMSQPDRQTDDCGKGKWLRRYEATRNGQATELALLRSTGGQLHGTIWMPEEKRTAILVGKMMPGGDFNLYLKKENGKPPAHLTGILEEKGSSQPMILGDGGNSTTLIFRQIEMFEAGCTEWADYVASFDAIFPKTKNGTVNEWFEKKSADWMNRCRDHRAAQKTPSAPAIRASQRATGWADLACWNERIFSGILHFEGIDEAALSSSEAFNFDLETGRDIRPEDLFIGSFDFARWCEPVLQKEKTVLSAAKSDEFFKKWIAEEPFNLRTIRREGLAFSTKFSPIYGQPTVVIPWGQLRQYLKNDAPVAGFAR